MNIVAYGFCLFPCAIIGDVIICISDKMRILFLRLRIIDLWDIAANDIHLNRYCFLRAMVGNKIRSL